jgi:hypothetical protein
MTYESKFGKAEGLADRLDEWAARVSHDKSLPWIGLGIIADIRAAAALLRGELVPSDDVLELEYDL